MSLPDHDHPKDKEPLVLSREEQVHEVIRLMDNGSSENAACLTVGINRTTFRSAVLKYAVVDNYAHALEAMAQNQVDLVESAISDMRDGTINAKMARVEIDTRKWFASKFLPKRYGDKLDLNHGGRIDTSVTSELTEAQIIARLAEIQAAAKTE